MADYEKQGTGYDPHAVGHERVGQAQAPDITDAEHAIRIKDLVGQLNEATRAASSKGIKTTYRMLPVQGLSWAEREIIEVEVGRTL